MLATVCVAKDRLPATVTHPITFACREHTIHFRGEPRLQHPKLPEAGHTLPEKGSRFHLYLRRQPESREILVCGTLVDKKSTGISSLFIVFHFILLFIHPVWWFDLCFTLPFPPMQKASADAWSLYSAKHLHKRLGYDRSPCFICWQVHFKSRKNAFLCMHLILFVHLCNSFD